MKFKIFVGFIFLIIFFIACSISGSNRSQNGGDKKGSVSDNYVLKPIAHIDLVPYQTITSLFNIGVVAFHKDGISKVVFRFSDSRDNNLTISETSSMINNNRTGVVEYWVTFNPAGFNDGAINISAEVIPNKGASRLLKSIIINNSGGSLSCKSVYVHPTLGDDLNYNGLDQDHPFQTIARALDYQTVSGGDTIILMAEDEYIAPYRNIAGHLATIVDRYITIKPADGLDRDNVKIIGNSTVHAIKPAVSHLKWENVTFDITELTALNYRYIFSKSYYLWLDKCIIIDNIPPTEHHSQYLGFFQEFGYYATNSSIKQSKFGFIHANLVRNCDVNEIVGDCYQMSKCILNCTVSDVDCEVIEHHTDIYQVWDEHDNILVYGLNVSNAYCQNFFLEPDRENVPGVQSLTNSAFVNITIDNYYNNGHASTGEDPHSQLLGRFRHVIFKNLNMPEQQFHFRVDTAAQPFVGEDVILDSCTLVFDDNAVYSHTNPPAGVTIKNSTILYPPLL